VLRAAVPLFPEHRQPVPVGELGEYDLLDPFVHRRQAQLAVDHGVDAFCYWRYWSCGEQLLEQPVAIASELDLPVSYCLGWANQDWTRIWHGDPRQILRQQCYGDRHSFEEHFTYLAKHFKNRRYVYVRDQPLLYLYRPADIPNMRSMLEVWRACARAMNVPMPYLVGEVTRREFRFASNTALLDSRVVVDWPQILGVTTALRKRLFAGPVRVAHRRVIRGMLDSVASLGGDPIVLTGWDNTPRRARRGWVIDDFDANQMAAHVLCAVEAARCRGAAEVLWVKSWNEWTEGNYLEPDATNGRCRLTSIREALERLRS
jgi:hypothetical protein